MRTRFFRFLLILTALLPATAAAQSGVVIFYENGFPSSDSAAVPEPLLRNALPGAQFASAKQLKESLGAAKLLVLPYGSAFPEEAWADIQGFLQRGGNLLVLGGRPFTGAAYRDGSAWKLRDYSVRYTQPLRIDQYQETPSSEGLKFESNPDIPLAIPQFAWKRGYSPIIHLSAVDLYNRGGSAGSIDSNLDALAWGAKDGRRMSAPVVEIDHLRNGFDGGRWIFVDADLGADFYNSASAGEILSKLANQALEGAEEFTVRPVMPLYLAGETVQLEIQWNPFTQQSATAEIEVVPDSSETALNYKSAPTRINLTTGEQTVVLPPAQDKGLYFITAKLKEKGELRSIYHSAFWVRDLDYLRSGPKLTVNQDYFELDGKPLAVVGTTYMSSEVQRLFFDHPNVYVWDRDMRQIHDAGLNMIRTGWWTGWDKFADENGVPYERTLRTLEAYLMTARKYGLPVQFNFFAFLPDVLGGVNAYLDPEAVRKQKTLAATVAARFRDVPFLAYDLINEPSFSKRIWTMRPNGDWIEAQKWDEWLNRRYPDRGALAAAWSVPVTSVQGGIPVPQEIDFSPRAMYSGRNPLKIFDFEMFAQESFAGWVRALREGIRGTGSNQLITIGQDEGGFQDRLSPAFFGPEVDFTTNHTWWQNDSLLWDSLVAKQPGKAMLIQETGLQRELNLDETARLTTEDEAKVFERKLALSFAHGSGAIEWLWNTNSYMTEGNETPIGALRADGSEKPEATVMRNFAKLAAQLSPHLRDPEQAQVAVIASQAAQYSALAEAQIEAQRKSVRALAYYAHLTPYVVYENHIDEMGSPKLAILPSAQALGETAWQALLKYVDNGGNLLITGSVDRNEHWQHVNRAAELIPDAKAVPITYHSAKVLPEDQAPIPALLRLNALPLSFDLESQSSLESLRFGHEGFVELNHGKGRIFWVAEPVELAQGDQPTADVYAYVAARIGIRPLFNAPRVSPGILIYSIPLADSILYVIASDANVDWPVEFQDQATGTRVTLDLAAGHAAVALIGKKEKGVVAKYGF